ncbi:Mediator of replication checkpoint protein 1 [Cyphellophora attinorum]|uniref:Mediator of replication checkpoint protein 1 n=1 Tax=Cyphellophora attinorum TaxID=1664694 RepID=A0A0N1P0Q3_9EURO|nr:Mediator of replication checkpoint protein 1 [Phialophora attinorum]KPI40396.1 Mediator of replication checkpoint protein 1 [Phialophora attinorum]
MASSPVSAADAAGSDAEMLTPSRKVRALLAQFDDSDSENEASNTRVNGFADRKTNGTSSSGAQSSDDSDDDAPVVRKSRMAARLEPETQRREPTAGGVTAAADERKSDGEQSREDAAPRRRLLTKRKSRPGAPSTPATSVHSSAAHSPLFFPSPTRSQAAASDARGVAGGDASDGERSTLAEPLSKFQALVEKQAKLRLEREKAEEAKRAARQASLEEQARSLKRQRGSSPGDDSHESSEGSDADAARRIAKRAKPTRKASKKAIEEMKRETQRLSRNNQLAHQAQVRKKITKESLLARFGLAPKNAPLPEQGSASRASSVSDSDSEVRHHSTPPTSPMQSPPKDTPKDLSKQSATDQVVEAPPLAEIGLEPLLDVSKGKGKAIEGAPDLPEPVILGSALMPTVPTATAGLVVSTDDKVDKRAKIKAMLRAVGVGSADDADDDELDVVTNPGDQRKYAAFEKLPKHKAKETTSHLALRTLAHVHERNKDDKSTMTQAEMAANLRKAARLQARAERQQRIDELRAKGVVIQTAEERDRDQEVVEDLVERAREEAAELARREKEAAKKDGTFEPLDLENEEGKLFDDQADDDDEEEEEEVAQEDDEALRRESDDEEGDESDLATELAVKTPAAAKVRNTRVISDDEDDAPQLETPKLPQLAKTPQTISSRSARKQIPGLNMSDDLPLGLTQAFGATMADSQSQTQQEEKDSMDYVHDLPSPGLAIMPRLNRMESLDLVTDSQPATQTQPLDISLTLSQPQAIPESPSLVRGMSTTQPTPSQAAFEPTQDADYVFSPFHGNRFTAESPSLRPHSTIDTVPLNEVEASPILVRKGRLRRGRAVDDESEADDGAEADASVTAFEVMKRAAKKAEMETFDKTKSKAKDIVDEAAEESDDEYAGLGGASDDENAHDVENEDDRRIIDDDTQVGKGDEAALAGFYADRERKSDEAAVNKLYQEIKTGKLRNRRAVGGDLDLSDEEDEAARRSEAKRREHAKMRRELLKDEAVGKIADDRKKEAFLRSIEDRHDASDDDELEVTDKQDESQSQDQAGQHSITETQSGLKRKRPLDPTSESQLNRLPPALRRTAIDKKPSTVAEIRENLSFLFEEPDSLSNSASLELSDSDDDDPGKYVNLDRHYDEAEADELAAADEDGSGLGDFVVDDEEEEDSTVSDGVFKKPNFPYSASFSSRTTNTNPRRSRGTVINRLSLTRASSTASSTTSNGLTKMAFMANTATVSATSTFRPPSLLRRATTNSSLSSLSSENVSATGVSIAKTERGHVSEEKAFVRKGMGGRRNAVNYQAGERPQQKAAGNSRRGKGGAMGKNAKGGGGGGFLNGLLRGDTWG